MDINFCQTGLENYFNSIYKNDMLFKHVKAYAFFNIMNKVERKFIKKKTCNFHIIETVNFIGFLQPNSEEIFVLKYLNDASRSKMCSSPSIHEDLNFVNWTTTFAIKDANLEPKRCLCV